ncbi:MAG: hypothetical protein ACKV2V_17020, partial [Blastocatellia bacterium]
MNKHENRQLEMFRRVRDFGVTRQADFTAGSPCLDLFTAIGEIVSDLVNSNADEQAERNHTRVESATRTAAREELLTLVTHIHLAARVMSRKNPALAKRFALTERHTNTNENLMATALNFAVEATPLAAEFARHEMAPDFIETLRGLISTFEQSGGQRNTAKSNARAATRGIDETIVLGRQ